VSGVFGKNQPTPPNPMQTAAATTATNVDTAVAQSFLNNTNQVTPGGSLTYTQNGTASWVDPTTGQTWNVPRFTAVQQNTPELQSVMDTNTNTMGTLAGTANTSAGQLRQLMSSPINLSGAPPASNFGSILQGQAEPQFRYDPGGQQQTTFGDAGDITRSYGPNDFSADRTNVENALYARMDPQLQRDRASLDAKLADQGIQVGSPAYQAAWDQFNRQLTDTRLGITQTAGQEQQRMQQEAQAQAQFQNQAQQQAFQEAQARGQFANTAQANQFAQNAQQAQFYNTAAQQQFARQQAIASYYDQQRAQWLNEQYAARSQPINEITALMSGSQVKNPTFMTTPTTQVANTDTAGIINANFNQQMQNYTAQANAQNQLIGGLFGGMAGMLSDRREKENIQRMGSVLATDADADDKRLPIYSYSYKDDPMSVRHIGPMAQDVEKVDNSAVFSRGGKKYINTTRLGSILKVA